MLTVIAVTVVGGFAWYVMSPEERALVLRRVSAPYHRVHQVATAKSAPDTFLSLPRFASARAYRSSCPASCC